MSARKCLCGCGARDRCCELVWFGEHATLMSMPTIVPDPDEPCQDCDDDKFALEHDAGDGGAPSVGTTGRTEAAPSDFDNWDARVTRRVVR